MCYLKLSQIQTGIVHPEAASVAKIGEDLIRYGNCVVVSSCYNISRKLTRVPSVPQLHLESSVDAAQSHGLVTHGVPHVHLFDNCQVSIFK